MGKGPERVDNADEGTLEVTRRGHNTGFGPWRSATYEVYQRTYDGTRRQVLRGRYRDHRDALSAARKLLREEEGRRERR